MTKDLAQGFRRDVPEPLAAAVPDLLAWHDGLALGLAEMDRQHRELLVQVSALLKVLTEPGGHAARLSRLDELLAAAHRHFDWEEALMAAHGYARLDLHHDQHTELLGAIERLRDDLGLRRHAVDRPRVQRFLADWFRVHIAHSDADFVANLRREADAAGATGAAGMAAASENENGHPQVAV